MRARELWEQLGSPSEFLHVPYGQSRYHAHRGEFDLALRLDEDLLRLSRQRDDPAGLVLGHYSSGRNLMLAGRFASSLKHLEDVLTHYDPISQGSLIRQAGEVLGRGRGGAYHRFLERIVARVAVTALLQRRYTVRDNVRECANKP